MARLNAGLTEQFYEMALKDSVDRISLDAYSRAKHSQVSYDPATGLTTFAFYSPLNHNRHTDKRFVLEIWEPTADLTREYRKVGVSDQFFFEKDRFFYAVFEGIKPGMLYRLIDSYGQDSIPLDAEGLIYTGEGYLATVVDHQSFQWRDIAHLQRGTPPAMIHEIHIGTATQERTFAAYETLVAQGTGIDADPSYVEFLPLHPGNHPPQYSIVYRDKGRGMELIETPLTLTQWGYERLPFLKALEPMFGREDQFKSLVSVIKSKGGAVCLDVQLAFMGCGILAKDDHIRMKDAFYSTPYGPSIRLDDDYIFWWTLFAIRHLIQTYHLDALRLDSADLIFDHLKRPDLIARLAAMFPEYRIQSSDENLVFSRQPLVIAEATHSGDRVLEQTRTSYTWDFSFKDFVRNISAALNHADRYVPEDHYLWQFVRNLLTHVNGIIFTNSHDDPAGNDDGKPLRNVLLRAQQLITRGLPMEFYNGFFSFFRNREERIAMIDTMIEMSYYYRHFTHEDWDRKLQNYWGPFYRNLDELKAELVPLRERIYEPNRWNWRERFRLEKEFFRPVGTKRPAADHVRLGPPYDREKIDRFYRLSMAHFLLMQDLATDPDYNRDDHDMKAAILLKSVRVRHPWLTGSWSVLDTPFDGATLVAPGTTLVRRVNPADHREQVIVAVNYSFEPHVQGIKLPPGEWCLHRLPERPKDGSDRIMTQSLNLTQDIDLPVVLNPKEALIIEALPRENGVNYLDVWNVFMQGDRVKLRDPRQALSPSVIKDEIVANAGQIRWQDQEIYFGFGNDGKLILFSEQPFPSVEVGYAVPHDKSVADLQILDGGISFQAIESDFAYAVEVNLAQLRYADYIGVNGSNTAQLYLMLPDHQPIQVHIPR